MTVIDIENGATVRVKGKRQIMTVKGEVGLSSYAHRFGSGQELIGHKVVCEWRTQRGGMKSAAFLVSALEVVPAQILVKQS